MNREPDPSLDSAATPTAAGAVGVGGDREFSDVACRLGVLTRAIALEVTLAAKQAGVLPVEFALMKTLIQPVDADIISSLMDPSQAIPGYEIVNLLGRGGMGVVYRARQHSLDRPVALKSILLSQLSTPLAAQRFEQEARSLARLAHPHIIAVYDFGRHANRLFFAMELVEGEDVEKLVRRTGALKESLAWHLVRQAASGLAHAANAGIVHRDVKPANLLLVTPPEGFQLPPGVPLVKIADFGLALLATGNDATAETRLTSDNVHVGSPLYMAPEQIQSGSVDHRADIFSLGMTAWQMLAGHPPLMGKSLSQVIMQRLSVPTESVAQHNPQVSRASAELVAAMLQPDPAHRIGEYATLLAAIDRVLSGVETHPDLTSTLIAPQNEATRVAIDRASAAADIPDPSAAPVTGAARSTRTSRRKMVLSAIALALIGAVAWAMRPVPPRIRDFVGDGLQVALFDGETLAGWRVIEGAWQPGADAEGGRVLVGSNGTIAYSPATPATEGSPVNFRIGCSVDFSSAEQVELECDFAPTDARRLVVRLARDALVIGVRDADRGDWRRVFPIPKSLRFTRVNANVCLERQRQQWWILIDDEVAAVVPFCHPTALPEVRLRVERGTAQFADLFFEALSLRAT